MTWRAEGSAARSSTCGWCSVALASATESYAGEPAGQRCGEHDSRCEAIGATVGGFDRRRAVSSPLSDLRFRRFGTAGHVKSQCGGGYHRGLDAARAGRARAGRARAGRARRTGGARCTGSSRYGRCIACRHGRTRRCSWRSSGRARLLIANSEDNTGDVSAPGLHHGDRAEVSCRRWRSEVHDCFRTRGPIGARHGRHRPWFEHAVTDTSGRRVLRSSASEFR